MPSNKTVDVNGRAYDRVTGMPITTPTQKPTPAERNVSAASSVHAAPQRSQTLHRRATKKPGLLKRSQVGRHMDIARSNDVARFSKEAQPQSAKPAQPTTVAVANRPKHIDIGPAKRPVTHPLARKAAARPVHAPATAKQTKEAAIARALDAPKATSEEPLKQARRFFWSRRASIVTALLSILLLTGVITFFNLPTISVAVASSQADVAAVYPKYIPDGYHLAQPVGFKSGEVSLTFQSISNESKYIVTQATSSWDSSAVLDNIVRKEVGENYATNRERGLTIFTYDGNAAWVTGGILYTIDSSAPLSTDQVLRIASSLT